MRKRRATSLTLGALVAASLSWGCSAAKTGQPDAAELPAPQDWISAPPRALPLNWKQSPLQDNEKRAGIQFVLVAQATIAPRPGTLPPGLHAGEPVWQGFTLSQLAFKVNGAWQEVPSADLMATLDRAEVEQKPSVQPSKKLDLNIQDLRLKVRFRHLPTGLEEIKGRGALRCIVTYSGQRDPGWPLPAGISVKNATTLNDSASGPPPFDFDVKAPF